MTDLSEVLVTGAGGMLGRYIDFGIKTDRNTLDITKPDEVSKIIKKYKPKIILHLAAETDVDKCECNPEHAYLINAIGTYNVALSAKNFGAKMVYISTAGVFDGEKNGPYDENDEPNPKNYYGHSKFLGELAVKSLSEDFLILRTCWMMGGYSGDKKFVSKIIKQLNDGAKEIKAISDQVGSPTYAKDLSRAIKILIENDERGIIHLSDYNIASRYDVAKFIADYFKSGVKVIAVDSQYFNLDAKRTKNEALCSRRDLMRPWQDALSEYLGIEWDID